MQNIEKLNREKIQLQINPTYLNNLTIELFDTIDSTNTYLLNQNKSETLSRALCFAETQTAGRGRQGKSWFSSNNNLSFSLLWRFDDFKKNNASLSLAIAVMVLNALKKYGINEKIFLKWPNDILFSERKLAGILIECVGNAAIIGIGLNLSLSMEQRKTWSDLEEIVGQKIERNYLAGLLVNELLEKLPLYQTSGLSAFMSEWEQYDLLKNKKIHIHTENEIISGVMRGINLQGELLLENSRGILRQFRCGEVSVRF